MKLSLITATFNCEQTIFECINSVNNQTCCDIEHIIIDGASTDNTIKIIKANPNRVKLIISEPDNGIYDALNKGINHSTGEIIGFLHADDEFGSSVITEHILKIFNKNDLDIVYGDLVYVNRENRAKVLRYWKSKTFSGNRVKKGWMPPHPTIFIKKSVYLKYGMYDQKYKISADYDYILRILLDKGLKIGYIPEVITKMAIGGKSNKNIKNLFIKSYEDYKILKGNEIHFPFLILLLKNLRKLDQFFIRPPEMLNK